MSMNSYAFEEKAALSVSPQMACAIILYDTYYRTPMQLRADIRDAIDHGVPFWKAAFVEEFCGWLNEQGFYNISDAYDVLSNAHVNNLVHCSEFFGSGSTAEGFEGSPVADQSWEDDFVCFLTPARAPSLFKQAYDGPDALVGEYRESIGQFLGDGFDYKANILDVTGTYYC